MKANSHQYPLEPDLSSHYSQNPRLSEAPKMHINPKYLPKEDINVFKYGICGPRQIYSLNPNGGQSGLGGNIYNPNESKAARQTSIKGNTLPTSGMSGSAINPADRPNVGHPGICQINPAIEEEYRLMDLSYCGGESRTCNSTSDIAQV